MNTNQIQLAAQKDFDPRIVYVTGGIIIAVLLYSDAMTVAESLLTGYPHGIAYFIAFGIVGAIDLIYFGIVFAFKQLFAWGKIATATFAFYAAMAIVLGAIGLYSAVLVVNHIDALGSKQRRILNPYDFSGNPALVAARQSVNDLKATLNATDSTILSISRATANASLQAASFSGAFTAAVRDTNLSKRQKSDLAFYAGRANKVNLNVATALGAMQKDRWRTATQLLAAQDNYKAVFDSLAERFGGKSAEDVIEADMGISLKRGVATMTQFGVIAVLLVIFMMRAASTGKLEYNPIAFVPASGAQKLANNSETKTAPEPDFIMPARLTDESKQQYALRVAQMYSRGEFAEFVNATYLAGRLNIKCGTFSKLVHGKLGKTYFSNGKPLTTATPA